MRGIFDQPLYGMGRYGETYGQHFLDRDPAFDRLLRTIPAGRSEELAAVVNRAILLASGGLESEL